MKSRPSYDFHQDIQYTVVFNKSSQLSTALLLSLFPHTGSSYSIQFRMKDLTNHLSFDSVDQSVSCTNMEYLILTDRDFRSLILSTSRLRRKDKINKILKQILTNCFVKICLKQTVKEERNKPAVIWLLCNRYARGKTGFYGFAYQQTRLARPVPVA